MLALVLKHFICDFPLQACPFMYLNKGTYGHIGGIFHAIIHVLGTFFVVAIFFSPLVAGAAAVVDGFAHYHIDFAKMRIGALMGWGPTTSEWFWILLGFDQLLHYLTYFGIVYALS